MNAGDAAVTADSYGANHVATCHVLSVPDGGIHWLVSRAKFAVSDRDHTSPGELSSKGDGARTRSADGRANRGREVNTSVPGQPRLRRRIERLYHLGR